MRLRRSLTVAVVPLLLAAVACAPEEDDDSPSATDSNTGTAGESGDAEDCSVDSLALRTPGQLTVGTDSPAYEPWFVDNDPSNGKGFESAVAYAVAEQLGFSEDQVKWVKVPVQLVVRAGSEGLRLRHQPDLDQRPSGPRPSTSPTATTTAAQAVIALEGTAGRRGEQPRGPQGDCKPRRADRHDLADRDPRHRSSPSARGVRGHQRRRSRRWRRPGRRDPGRPADGVLHHGGARSRRARLVGQFQPETGEQEEFGLLFEKGSALVPCVNQALATLQGGRHARPARAASGSPTS